MINNVQIDEVALDEKIAKRIEEMNRHQRRLEMLKTVRYKRKPLKISHSDFID